MKMRVLGFLCVWVAMIAVKTAQGAVQYVEDSPSSGSFAMVAGDQVAPLSVGSTSPVGAPVKRRGVATRVTWGYRTSASMTAAASRHDATSDRRGLSFSHHRRKLAAMVGLHGVQAYEPLHAGFASGPEAIGGSGVQLAYAMDYDVLPRT